MRERLTNQRLIAIFFVGLILLNYPLFDIFSVNRLLLGVPILCLYVFLAWWGLIMLMAFTIERS